MDLLPTGVIFGRAGASGGLAAFAAQNFRSRANPGGAICVKLNERETARSEEREMGLAGREGRIFFLAAAGMAFAATCSASPLAIARASGETARLAVAEVPRAATANPAPAPTPVPGQAQAAVTQSLGTVKAINGNVITLTLDAGTDATVNVQDTTKIVQVAPGQKDLKTATPIHISDLQVGDRILVRSRAADDPKSVAALGIIAMKRTDVDAKKTQDREDWQKSGVGGLVKEVDPATGNITISVPAPAGPAKTTVIHTTKATILRRYAPDSVKFDDAKPAPIDQIKPGDQLRARGEKSTDGDSFNAVEIVSGTFRNIAGIITSVDAAAQTISMMDLIAKSPVTVKITDQSQLKNLPPEIAQRIAMRLRGAGAGGGAASNGDPGGATGSSGAGAAPRAAGTSGAGAGAGARGGRADFQQLVNRLPASGLTDFQKGEAVLVVATQGTDSGGATAITVVGGVEPILAAAPGGGGAGAALALSPWSLGGAPGGDTGGIQ
jgi:hypothetical protein